jgi:hypothetical protein
MTEIWEVLDAIEAAWSAQLVADSLPGEVKVGNVPDVLPDVLCSVGIGDLDRGGATASPSVDDMASGYLTDVIVRCMVTVFDGSLDWRVAAGRCGSYYRALLEAVRADVTLGGLTVDAFVATEQEWHFDAHAEDGGTAGVEFAVVAQVQQ